LHNGHGVDCESLAVGLVDVCALSDELICKVHVPLEEEGLHEDSVPAWVLGIDVDSKVARVLHQVPHDLPRTVLAGLVHQVEALAVHKLADARHVSPCVDQEGLDRPEVLRLYRFEQWTQVLPLVEVILRALLHEESDALPVPDVNGGQQRRHEPGIVEALVVEVGAGLLEESETAEVASLRRQKEGRDPFVVRPVHVNGPVLEQLPQEIVLPESHRHVD